MPSKNERQRWEQWYEQVTVRMDRQKESIVRLVAINTEAMAALEEISAAETEGVDLNVERAHEALDRIKGSAATEQVESVESIETETPVDDPRGKQR